MSESYLRAVVRDIERGAWRAAIAPDTTFVEAERYALPDEQTLRLTLHFDPWRRNTETLRIFHVSFSTQISREVTERLFEITQQILERIWVYPQRLMGSSNATASYRLIESVL